MMTNLTISLDDAIVRKARIRAIEEGTSVSAKVREFLAQYAKVDSTPEVRLPELPIFKGSTGLQHGIDPSSNKSMLQAADEMGASARDAV
jgi:plasmid stability protein